MTEPLTFLVIPTSDFFFEIAESIGFFYVYGNDYPWAYIGDPFRTMINCVHRGYPKISILSEIVLP